MSVDDSLELEKCDHVEDVVPSAPSSPTQNQKTPSDKLPKDASNILPKAAASLEIGKKESDSTATSASSSPPRSSNDTKSPPASDKDQSKRAGLLGVLPSMGGRTNKDSPTGKSQLESSDGYEDEAFDNDDEIDESIDESIEGFDESNRWADSKSDDGEVV